MGVVVRVESLHKEFVTPERRVVALEDVSFVAEGFTFVSVIGPSGCGKSTLLNILAGIETPSSGSVEMLRDGKAARVGYVFQSPRLLPWLSVIDNLIFVHADQSSEEKERCAQFLEMVGLGGVQKSYPGQLSGGMQQRVGIARAFAIEPDILLMDEPFSHLDAITGEALRVELHSIWEKTQKTVIFVTHDVAEAVDLSNRVVILGKGGYLLDIVDIDLPFPRDRADDKVALTTADLMRRLHSSSQHRDGEKN
jgi:NitT/TauT family transport system ATP-binding protein